MIRIIEDSSGLIKDDAFIYLNEYCDYVSIFEAIQKAIQKRSNLTVIVKKVAVVNWFEKLKSRYEDNVIEIEKVTYKTNLQSVWGISIADKYLPDELEELDLINLDVYPKPNETFEDFILSYYYDAIFSNHSFTPGLIVQLIKSYDKSKWENNSRSILLTKIYEERLTEWRNKIREDNLLVLLNDIIVDSEKMKTELMLYKVLRTKIYNDICKLVFRSRYEQLQRLRLNLKEIEIDY